MSLMRQRAASWWEEPEEKLTTIRGIAEDVPTYGLKIVRKQHSLVKMNSQTSNNTMFMAGDKRPVSHSDTQRCNSPDVNGPLGSRLRYTTALFLAL